MQNVGQILITGAIKMPNPNELRDAINLAMQHKLKIQFFTASVEVSLDPLVTVNVGENEGNANKDITTALIHAIKHCVKEIEGNLNELP